MEFEAKIVYVRFTFHVPNGVVQMSSWMKKSNMSRAKPMTKTRGMIIPSFQTTPQQSRFNAMGVPSWECVRPGRQHSRRSEIKIAPRPSHTNKVAWPNCEYVIVASVKRCDGMQLTKRH